MLHVICPSCEFFFAVNRDEPTDSIEEVFLFGGQGCFVGVECPSCQSIFCIDLGGLLVLDEVKLMPNGTQVFHKTRSRPPLPPEVPPEYRKDYDEASSVLHLSPKASAALSRRVLQHFLHHHHNINGANLHQEIQMLLRIGRLPPYVSDVLDVVRSIGNAAAHPLIHVQTGEIIEVERGDAEWLLEVLEKLFDFYFVQTKRTHDKKEDIAQRMEHERRPPRK